MRIIPITWTAPLPARQLKDAMQDDKATLPPSERASGDHAGGPASTGTRRVSSVDLFAGARELEIEHNGRRYQLRITQTGKLILTA
jgi:hemin uptake protein HemP